MRPGGGLSRAAAALFALAVLFVAPAAGASPVFPKLEGRRVVDDAQLIAPEAETTLARKLETLEAATGRQLVVATLPSLQGYEIEDFGYRLGRTWGIGSAQRNDGVLLIVAPKERKVRIEVGYGLEPVLTDALSSTIIQSAILPRFRDGDMEGGVIAGTDAIVQQLSLPDDQARTAAAVVPPVAARDSDWWVRPLVGFIVSMVVTVVIPALWLGFSGLFAGFGISRPREIRRRSDSGLVDWSGGSFGGDSSASGGYSGGGGSFGGGGASGSW